MDKRQVEKCIEENVSAVYDQALYMLKEEYRFKPGKSLYGEPFEDTFQRALMRVVKSIHNQAKDGVDISCLDPSYYFAAIMTNFKQIMHTNKRHMGVVHKHEDNVKHIMYNNGEQGNSAIEVLEIQNFKSNFGGKTKAFIKMLEEGENIRDIKRKLGMGKSMRKFYKVRNRIQDLAASHGYDNK